MANESEVQQIVDESVVMAEITITQVMHPELSASLHALPGDARNCGFHRQAAPTAPAAHSRRTYLGHSARQRMPARDTQHARLQHGTPLDTHTLSAIAPAAKRRGMAAAPLRAGCAVMNVFTDAQF